MNKKQNSLEASLVKAGKTIFEVYYGIGAAAMGLLALLIAFTVVARYFFALSWKELSEFNVTLFAFTTFWGMGVCLLRNDHVIIDIVYDRIKPSIKRWVAVFDYVFPFLEVFERHLMAGRHVRFQRDAPAVHLNFVSRTKGRDGHGHIVGRIDFQISSFHYDRIVVDCSQTCVSK